MSATKLRHVRTAKPLLLRGVHAKNNPLKFTDYVDAQGLFRWRAIRSGRIVAESGEGYSSRAKMRRAVVRLVLAVKDGKFIVALVA